MIAVWAYEPTSFHLAHDTWYRPDFLVITKDGIVEWHEVKGRYVRDDAKVKFKTAAAQYPWFRWALVTCPKGRWQVQYAETMNPHGVLPPGAQRP